MRTVGEPRAGADTSSSFGAMTSMSTELPSSRRIRSRPSTAAIPPPHTTTRNSLMAATITPTRSRARPATTQDRVRATTELERPKRGSNTTTDLRVASPAEMSSCRLLPVALLIALVGGAGAGAAPAEAATAAKPAQGSCHESRATLRCAARHAGLRVGVGHRSRRPGRRPSRRPRVRLRDAREHAAVARPCIRLPAAGTSAAPTARSPGPAATISASRRPISCGTRSSTRARRRGSSGSPTPGSSER